MEISVIIPMYNAGKTIVRALESVRNQTYKAHYQIIVINDGSTDRSLQVVNRYMQEHPEMDITIIDKPNGGVSSARNAGFKQATGQWIALLDSDDQWLPNKMEVQMKILEEHPEIDFIGSSIIGQHIRILWRLKDKLSPIKVWELFIRWHPWTPTCVFRRTILQDVGFYNESMHYAEDGEYLLRICMQKNCWYTPEQLVFCGGGKPGFGHSGLSANLKGMQQGQEAIIKYAYRQGAINGIQKVLFLAYSRLKHWRREFIVWKRKFNQ